MYTRVARWIIVSLIISLLLPVYSVWTVNASSSNTKMDTQMEVTCSDGDLLLNVWFYNNVDDNISISVLSPYGINSYIAKPQPVDALDSRVFFVRQVVGKCLSGAYRVDVVGKTLYTSLVFNIDNSHVSVSSGNEKLNGRIFLKGQWLDVNGYVSFDVYYENNSSATVSLTKKDISMYVLLYVGKYLLYSSVYDKEGKFVKYAIRNGQRLEVLPHQRKKIAVLSIPIPRGMTFNKDMKEDIDLYVFWHTEVIPWACVHIPIFKNKEFSSVPSWGEKYIEHFALLFGMPFTDLERHATRGDMAVLLMALTGSNTVFTATNNSVFKDVYPTLIYYTILNDLYREGKITGYPDGTYKPYNTLSRLESAIFLLKYVYGKSVYDMVKKVEVEGIFKDIPKESWYAPWIELAYRKGLVRGYEDGTFRPFSAITRLEVIILLDRMSIMYRK